VSDYRKLDEWLRRHRFTWAVYAAINPFSQDNLFGFTRPVASRRFLHSSQSCRRLRRDRDAELKRFVDVAHGAASATEDHLLLAQELPLDVKAGSCPAR